MAGTQRAAPHNVSNSGATDVTQAASSGGVFWIFQDGFSSWLRAALTLTALAVSVYGLGARRPLLTGFQKIGLLILFPLRIIQNDGFLRRSMARWTVKYPVNSSSDDTRKGLDSISRPSWWRQDLRFLRQSTSVSGRPPLPHQA